MKEVSHQDVSNVWLACTSASGIICFPLAFCLSLSFFSRLLPFCSGLQSRLIDCTRLHTHTHLITIAQRETKTKTKRILRRQTRRKQSMHEIVNNIKKRRKFVVSLCVQLFVLIILVVIFSLSLLHCAFYLFISLIVFHFVVSSR